MRSVSYAQVHVERVAVARAARVVLPPHAAPARGPRPAGARHARQVRAPLGRGRRHHTRARVCTTETIK